MCLRNSFYLMHLFNRSSLSVASISLSVTSRSLSNTSLLALLTSRSRPTIFSRAAFVSSMTTFARPSAVAICRYGVVTVLFQSYGKDVKSNYEIYKKDQAVKYLISDAPLHISITEYFHPSLRPVVLRTTDTS